MMTSGKVIVVAVRWREPLQTEVICHGSDAQTVAHSKSRKL
jgi:hypothetical protein